jgi:uncharacterized membrane protein YeaQ/YmgE (transglycosylase-associated protein family)
MDWIWIILIGLAAGWVASRLMRRRSLGLAGNLVVGVIGAILGAFIFEFIGISAQGPLATFVMAVVGAVVLLYGVQVVKKL